MHFNLSNRRERNSFYKITVEYSRTQVEFLLLFNTAGVKSTSVDLLINVYSELKPLLCVYSLIPPVFHSKSPPGHEQ